MNQLPSTPRQPKLITHSLNAPNLGHDNQGKLVKTC